MHFTDLFIRRPVLAIVLSLLLLLLGLKAFSTLQVRQYPEVVFPILKVTTAYPGANASLIKGFITTPILNEITGVEGIDYTTANSTDGTSSIMVYLDQDYNVDAALLEISSKVNKVRHQLPVGAEAPLVEKQESMGSDTLQYIAFSSDVMTPEQITDYVSKVILPDITTITGMGKVNISGKRSFAMRVWLNADRMAAFNITAEDVELAVNRSNYQSAAGRTEGNFVLFNVDANTVLQSVEDFENIVVTSEEDALVRLSDIARVELGSENYHQATRFDGKTAVFVQTSAAATANPLEVGQLSRRKLEEIKHQLPPLLQMKLVFDTTHAIQASIDEVVQTLIEASIIVIIVIFLFLGSTRSVIIPVVTIPLSLIGVVFVMMLLGFSVNLLTLLAMVLAIGLVVDDAIVVVENIQRHIEEGVKPFEAALVGAREIAFPVIAMTITLAAVYGPIGFLEGLTGTLFTEFAFTLAGAVIVSGVIALTLSPMMCSRMLREDESEHGFVKFLDRAFDKLKDRYQKMVHAALQMRAVGVVFSVIVLIAIILLYREIPQELAPQEDHGVVFVSGGGPLSTNLNYMKAYGAALETQIEKIPERDQSFIWLQQNRMFALVKLEDWDHRERSAKEVGDALLRDVDNVTGVKLFTFNPPSLPGAPAVLPIQYILTSMASEEIIYQVAIKIVEKMKASGLFTYVQQDITFDKPELQLSIDRDKAAELGVSMENIGHVLAIMLGENNTGRFSINDRSYKVILQVDQLYRANPENLDNYYVKTNENIAIPLSTIVSVDVRPRPSALTQFQQRNSANIGAMLAPGVSLGEAVSYLDELAKRELPDGFQHDYFGQARQFLNENNVLLVTFVFSFLLIYLVLAAQFESFRDPVIVLISVPMSICGALIPMALGFTTMNIYTQIGLVTLIGLISKHGILIVDFANKLQEQGLTPFEAVERAAAVRLRPILMTTAAMVFGVVPLLLASGAGAESRFSIGLVITSGMAIGTLFTLFVVPILYTLIAKSRQLRP